MIFQLPWRRRRERPRGGSAHPEEDDDLARGSWLVHTRLTLNIYEAREPRRIDGGRGGGKVGVLPLVLCRARDALVACGERDRPALREINGVLGNGKTRSASSRRRAASNRSLLRSLPELPPSRLAWFGLAWLGSTLFNSTRLDSTWLGSARLRWLSAGRARNASARGRSARE